MIFVSLTEEDVFSIAIMVWGYNKKIKRAYNFRFDK